MQILNILVAIIVALGFWRKSGDEINRKTAKASFTKTFILLLLVIGCTFFYYKTYQVATFYNYIDVNCQKGAFDTQIEKYTYEGESYEIKNLVSRDRISSLSILSRFSDEDFLFLDPKRDLYEGRIQSGIRVKLELDNRQDSTMELSSSDDPHCPSNIGELAFCYDVSLMTNTIPSLFPMSVYEESMNKGYFMDKQDTTMFTSFAKRLPKRKDTIWGDIDKLYCLRLASNQKEPFVEEKAFCGHINTLNFFSAADLSQCNYLFIVRSRIPIDEFNVCFDIPIEVSSAEINHNILDSRDFSIELEEDEFGIVDKFALYHVKFPTLANLQLIRSLILTTFLTALYSLFFTNFYFYCRMRQRNYLRKHHIDYKKRKRIILLWIPVGKIIVWSIIVLMTCVLILSMLNTPFSIKAGYEVPIKYLFASSFFLYCLFVWLIIYMLYKKGVYISTWNLYMRKVFESVKCWLQRINFKRRELMNAWKDKNKIKASKSKGKEKVIKKMKT